MFIIKLRFHIQRVTKISPTTTCAQVAVKADFVDKATANVSTKPRFELPRDEKLPESKMNIKSQTAMGPTKSQGPFIRFWVFSASGLRSIANQKGPIQSVDTKKERSYKSIRRI